MKKSIKKLFILAGLSLFTFIGINTVNAEAAINNGNFNIVCEPGEIEKGQEANCYLIAKVDNDRTTGAGVHGLLTKVTTSHLIIKDFKAGDGSANYVTETHTNGQAYTAATPASGVKCETTEGEICYGFFTKGASTAGLFKNTGKTNIPSIDAQYSAYTSFGYFKVQLDESATTKECGKLCVSATVANTSADYDKKIHLSSNAPCQEIKPKATVDTPNTGSFASITVLVAGALIAIGAIAIAKKNNKIYKI